MWAKDLDYRHSRVVQVIHFSSEVNLWVAPLLPTIAMHVPNYLDAHEKRRKMSVVPLPVTMGDYYERTSPPRTTDPPVILFLFKHRFFVASDDVIGW